MYSATGAKNTGSLLSVQKGKFRNLDVVFHVGNVTVFLAGAYLCMNALLGLLSQIEDDFSDDVKKYKW